MDKDVRTRIKECSPDLSAWIASKRRVVDERAAARKRAEAARIAGGDAVVVHGADNGKVLLTAHEGDAGPAGLVETRDPFDGAHLRQAPDGRFVSAAVGPVGEKRMGKHAKPRKYPASQMTSRGVAVDSMFDAMHERDLWLKEELGLNLVGGTVAGALEEAGDRLWGQNRTIASVTNRRTDRHLKPQNYKGRWYGG